MKSQFRFNRSIILFMLTVPLFIQSCSSTQPTVATQPEAATQAASSTVSYEKDIAPIMKQSCTPCHFPETGKKEMLDTYDAVKININYILERVQLEPMADGFMPFKSKKTPLTAAEIGLFKEWLKQNMPK